MAGVTFPGLNSMEAGVVSLGALLGVEPLSPMSSGRWYRGRRCRMPHALDDLKVPRRRGEVVAPRIRRFLFGFFFGVFWESTVSTRRYLMVWLDGAQASHRAVELRPGRKQAV
jgi:hypothetical protein